MLEVNKQRIHIKKLGLKNYKKFQNVSVEFSQGLNVLVGQNNAGKTSIQQDSKRVS
ncbi:AAA family ATPase [Patescibacteria group bacterium]|nr:AAA family ATPase [Patescibacteria group bacterium]MBU4016036.1 AAA family ATPase [Patescibacteria group bacterium]MBU4099195.1 AAA family ATPase [Patescibacteria group bacterium]